MFDSLTEQRLLQSRSQAHRIAFDEQFVPNTHKDTLRETLYQRFITAGATEREKIEGSATEKAFAGSKRVRSTTPRWLVC